MPGWGSGGTVSIDGQMLPPNTVDLFHTDAGYLSVFAIHVLAGRNFTDAEGSGDDPVALIDEQFAKSTWPGRSPIGVVIRDVASDGTGKDRTIVGVVSHVRGSLTTDKESGQVYLPVAASKRLGIFASAPALSPTAIATAVANVVKTVAPAEERGVRSEPFGRTMLRETSEAAFQEPLVATLGVLTLLLVGVGLFGVVTCLSEQRMVESGLRVALGARPANLGGAVMRQSVVPAVIGLAAGGAVGVLMIRFLRTLLVGVQPNSVVALVFVTLAILAVAVAAAARPARRALRIDPARVLRSE